MQHDVDSKLGNSDAYPIKHCDIRSAIPQEGELIGTRSREAGLTGFAKRAARLQGAIGATRRKPFETAAAIKTVSDDEDFGVMQGVLMVRGAPIGEDWDGKERLGNQALMVRPAVVLLPPRFPYMRPPKIPQPNGRSGTPSSSTR